jgi:tRNA 2-thiocytidine biosynthesis protein TtcA
MFYGGKLKAMPPKLLSDDKRNIVIRPMAYCKEKEISRYADLSNFPIIPCNLCGTQDNMQRQAIKGMLQQWDKSHPGRVETIFTSIANVSLSQLADTKNFAFAELQTHSANSNELNVVELV